MAQRTDSAGSTERTGPWAVSTRQVVYMVIGAALYGLLSWATATLRIPGPFNSQIRPGVAIPLFFGAAFGPVAGFFSGFVGNIIGDLLALNGFTWNWSLGNGLMGLIAGLSVYYAPRLNGARPIAIAVSFSILGIIVGMGFAAFTDMFVSGYTVEEAWAEFLPIFLSNAIAAIILVPILSVAWEAIRARIGQSGG